MSKTFRLVLVVLACLTMVGIVVAYGTEWFVERRIQAYLTDSLPSNTAIGEVDVNLLTATVELNNSTVTRNDERVASASKVTVNPKFWSLFRDVITIKEILLEDVEINVRRTAEGFNLSHTLDNMLASEAGIDTQSGTFPLVIERVILLNGRLNYINTVPPNEQSVSLSPVHAALSPMDFRSRDQEIEVSVALQPNRDRPPVTLKGTARPNDKTNVFSGTLNLNQFDLTLLTPVIPGPLRINSGTVSAELAGQIGRDRLTSEPARFDVNNLNFEHTDSTNRGDTPMDTTINWPRHLEMDPIELNATNVTYSHGETTWDASKGTVEISQLSDTTTKFELAGEIHLRRPASEVLFDLVVSPRPPYHTTVVTQLTSARVQDFNDLFLRNASFQVTKGRGESGFKGTVSRNHLDLIVELQLENLSIRNKKEVHSGFLNLPTPVIARYLSKQDGTLELSFRIFGAPSQPVVDVSAIRRRVMTNLGIDVAVMGTLGLPVFAGDMALEKVSGVSVIGEVRKQLGKIFQSKPGLKQTSQRDTGTVIQSPADRNR